MKKNYSNKTAAQRLRLLMNALLLVPPAAGAQVPDYDRVHTIGNPGSKHS